MGGCLFPQCMDMLLDLFIIDRHGSSDIEQMFFHYTLLEKSFRMDAIDIFLACDSSPCYHVLCDGQPVSPPPKSSQDPTDCHSGNPPVLLPGICRLVGGIPVEETELRNSDFDTSSYNYIHGHIHGHIYSTHPDIFSHSNGYHDSDYHLHPNHNPHFD